MKFAVGEIAILAVNSTNPAFHGEQTVGEEVEIVAIGPFPAGYKVDNKRRFFDSQDYIVLFRGERWGANENRLRKRYPPGADIARNMIKKLPRVEPVEVV